MVVVVNFPQEKTWSACRAEGSVDPKMFFSSSLKRYFNILFLKFWGWVFLGIWGFFKMFVRGDFQGEKECVLVGGVLSVYLTWDYCGPDTSQSSILIWFPLNFCIPTSLGT